jgi:hypothetical protein
MNQVIKTTANWKMFKKKNKEKDDVLSRRQMDEIMGV